MDAPRSADRRRFLAGVAATGLLAACSGDDDDVAADQGGDDDAGDAPAASDAPTIVGGVTAARFFGPYYVVGATARVPFGLADDEGLIPAADLPAEVTAVVRAPDGSNPATQGPAVLYSEGLPRPYYTLRFDPPTEGFHDIFLDTPWGEVVTQIQVVAADDPIASAIVAPGDTMPALVSPTVDDARGVDPICTRTPQCDLHTETVADVVGNARPSVVLVATPAFCQTVICGPVLDLLLDVVPDHPDVDFVHLEVFTNPDENSTPPVPEDFAPAVTELGLVFEPVLFAVDADGVVVERLDYIFGSEEIRAAVDGLLA